MTVLIEQVKEWSANRIAQKTYETWAREHNIEIQILRYLDEERRHRPAISSNLRRLKLYEAAQEGRRELGFGDHLVPYAHVHEFMLEEKLESDGVTLTPKELFLLRNVNHGFWLSTGFTTPSVRRAQNFRNKKLK